jgi:hypothetical protein
MMAQHPDRQSSKLNLMTMTCQFGRFQHRFIYGALILGTVGLVGGEAKLASAGPVVRASELQEAATAPVVRAPAPAPAPGQPVVQAKAGASALQGLSVGIDSATAVQLNWQGLCANCGRGSEMRLPKPTEKKSLLNIPISGPSGAVRPDDWFRIEPLPASFKPMTIKLN